MPLSINWQAKDFIYNHYSTFRSLYVDTGITYPTVLFLVNTCVTVLLTDRLSAGSEKTSFCSEWNIPYHVVGVTYIIHLLVLSFCTYIINSTESNIDNKYIVETFKD